MIVPHEQLRPGDVFLAGDYGDRSVRVVVLREGEQGRETVPPLTDRPCCRYWCRREDTGAEGYMTYGPGGVVDRVCTAWRPAVNGTGARPWFLCREAENPSDRHHESAAGELVRFASLESAQRAADRLNADVASA